MLRFSRITKLFLPLLFVITFSQIKAQVVINEFMASNLCNNINPNQILDNFGDCSDWVELYNPTGAPVNLGGYFFTDRITNLTKYEFPGGSIVPANGYLRIWLSGRVGVPFNLANIHVPFRIRQTADNEVVALVDPDQTTIVDVYDIVEPMQVGHSRGRFPNGSATWAVFTVPSMAAANAGFATAGYAPRPEFNVPAGYQGGAINLEITIPTPGPNFVIRYTTNGSFPSAASTLYTGPIAINATTTVMAATYTVDNSYANSFYEWSTYFFGADAHTVPTFAVSGTQVQTLLQGTQLSPMAAFEMFDENGQLVSKSMGDVNKHGNDSWAYPQRGFDWIDRDKMGYSHATNEQIFRGKDREEFKRYMFKSAANDNYPSSNGGCHIRDSYVMSLSQRGNLELDERTHESCVVYINGQYWGVYDYREKVDDGDFTLYYYNQAEHQIDFLKTWGGTWAEYGNINNWNTLRNFVLGNDMTDPTNYAYVETQLEVISMIDYVLINTAVVTADWLNWNTGWWRGYNTLGGAQKWRYILWDMEASFGHYVNYTGIPNTGPSASPCDPFVALNNPGGQGHIPMFNALMQNEEFFNTYINRFADLNNTLFSCETMQHHLDSLIGIIEPEMPRHIARWGGNLAGWENNVNSWRNWIDQRCNNTITTGLEDCLDLEAFELTIIFDGEGAVDLNSLNFDFTSSPWTGTYFGDVPIDLTAIPAPGGGFFGWEVVSGDLVIPDPDNPNQTIILTGDVTIIVHFIPLEEYEVTFIVEPAGSGTITVNGDLLPNYPFIDTLQAHIDHILIATPEPEWGFSHWSSNNHTFDPNDTTLTVTYVIVQGDTVVAHFYLLPVYFDLTVVVDAPGTGEVLINGVIPGGYPFTETYLSETLIILQAVPSPGYEFVGWQFQNHVVPNLEALFTSFSITSTDTVTAVFTLITDFEVTILTNPADFGTVTLDGVNIGSLWTGILNTGSQYQLGAVTAGPFFEFVGWQSTNGSIFSPNSDLANVLLQITQADTLVAMFIELPNFAITVKVEPEGTGRVMLDWSTLPYLPWTGQVLGMAHTDFKALANQEWKFSHWTTNSHSIQPNEELEEVWIDFWASDVVTAHFVPREFHFYMPNSFSPNGDGVNDIFRPVGNEWHPEYFRMQIFNRQGEKIFETTDAQRGWDGAEPAAEYYAQIEVYVYQVEVRNAINSEVETFSGHVTVIR